MMPVAGSSDDVTRTASVIGPAPPPAADLTWSDAEVLTASLTDPEVFGELYRRHAPAVHGFVLRRVGPEHADDVTAETFVTAFAIRRRFDPRRDSARPWLMGIAVKQVSRRWRAERARLAAVAALEGAPVDRRGPDEVADAAFARRVDAGLAAALRGLKRGDRDVLLLVAWAELEYAEVAEALGIPIGTVRSRLHRARRVVRAALPMSDQSNQGN